MDNYLRISQKDEFIKKGEEMRMRQRKFRKVNVQLARALIAANEELITHYIHCASIADTQYWPRKARSLKQKNRELRAKLKSLR